MVKSSLILEVEAAIAVQMMLTSKGEAARQYLEPQIREITLELLKIIRFKYKTFFLFKCQRIPVSALCLWHIF